MQNKIDIQAAHSRSGYLEYMYIEVYMNIFGSYYK